MLFMDVVEVLAEVFAANGAPCAGRSQPHLPLAVRDGREKVHAGVRSKTKHEPRVKSISNLSTKELTWRFPVSFIRPA
jgi:hypothetical protein